MPTDANFDQLLNKLYKREYKDLQAEYGEQLDAMYKIIEIGEPSVLPLIQLLKDPNSHWGLIAMALSRIGDERAIESLIAALKSLNTSDEYLSERREIVYALAGFNDPRSVDVLLEALNHRVYVTGDDGNRYEESDEKTIEAVEWALTKIGDPRALEPVFERILVDWYQDAEILIEW